MIRFYRRTRHYADKDELVYGVSVNGHPIMVETPDIDRAEKVLEDVRKDHPREAWQLWDCDTDSEAASFDTEADKMAAAIDDAYDRERDRKAGI